MSKEQEVVEAYREKYEGNDAKYAPTIARNDRIDFSKISGDTALPYLVEIQTDSFKWFIEKGLDEVLKEVFPIANYANTVFIDYVNCHFEAPEYGPLECKEGDLTYSSKLKVTLRLRNKQTGEIKEDNEVFMGDVPMMTDSGTFVVNGAERVIVSQIVRSPGAYFQDTADKSGAHTYNGEIIPTRGTWLQFESDLKGVMWVRIDRQRKMPATILFKALGIDSEKAITDLFGNSDSMKLTLAKDSAIHNGTEALIDIFKKLKPGEPITQDGVVNFLVQKFFDDKRYDLGRAGRFKYSTKLGVYDRLNGRVLAENLVSADGEIFTNKAGEAFVKDYKLTKEDVQELRDAEFFEKGAHSKKIKVNEKLDTFSNVTLVKVYANDKKEDGVTNIIGTDLTLNGDETHPSVSRVTISDMVACFSYFCNIQDGIGQTDDIDHLGNRRVRCVGELLQTQFRIGLTKMSKTVQQKMSITDLDTAKPQALVNIRPLTSSIREFFASSQLSQFMLASNNILGPKDGKPIVIPSQDMVVGNYYLTEEESREDFLARAKHLRSIKIQDEAEKVANEEAAVKFEEYAGLEGKVFASVQEVVDAYETKSISLHNRIAIRAKNIHKTFGEDLNKDSLPTSVEDKYLITTVGKIIFNEIFPDDFVYINDDPKADRKTIESWFVSYSDVEAWAKANKVSEDSDILEAYIASLAQESD